MMIFKVNKSFCLTFIEKGLSYTVLRQDRLGKTSSLPNILSLGEI